MLTEKKAAEIGPPGDGVFAYLKNGIPVAQLEMLDGERLATLFWRGSVSADEVRSCYASCLAELRQALNQPIPDETVIDLGTPNGVRSLPALSLSDDASHYGGHLLGESTELTFVRFSAVGPVPAVLWADLLRTSRSEIGFCSVLLTDAVLKLLARTSHVGLNAREIAQLADLTASHMPLQPQ